MLTPAAKRRRIDSANETLRKPFKSPAVTRDRNLDAAAPEPRAGTASSARTEAAKEWHPAQPIGSATGAASARRSETHLTPARQLSTPTRRPFSMPRPRQGVSPSPLRMTPPASRLPKTTGPRATPTGIRAAREFEDREEIIRQAERIRGGPGAASEQTDGELVALIAKWRAASRQAAEETFEASRDRVQRMGGMKAWRRTRMEEQRSFMERMMGEEPARDRDAGAEDEVVGSSPAGGVGAESDGDGGEGEEVDGQDEDEVTFARIRGGREDVALADMSQEFTMGTMLKSLNIDFDIIGYDEDTGWWRDG